MKYLLTGALIIISATPGLAATAPTPSPEKCRQVPYILKQLANPSLTKLPGDIKAHDDLLKMVEAFSAKCHPAAR